MSYEAKLAARCRAKAEELFKIAETVWDEGRRAKVLDIAEGYVRRAVALERMTPPPTIKRKKDL
jgi:hypothetical protein